MLNDQSTIRELSPSSDPGGDQTLISLLALIVLATKTEIDQLARLLSVICSSALESKRQTTKASSGLSLLRSVSLDQRLWSNLSANYISSILGQS